MAGGCSQVLILETFFLPGVNTNRGESTLCMDYTLILCEPYCVFLELRDSVCLFLVIKHKLCPSTSDLVTEHLGFEGEGRQGYNGGYA